MKIGGGLEAVHEPLSYMDISRLLTALAEKGFLCSDSSPSDRKTAGLQIFNAQVAYHLADEIRETEPCYVITKSGHTQTFDYSHDRIDSLPRSILYYFAPGTTIYVPEFCNTVNMTYIESNSKVFVKVTHQLLSPQEISVLVTAFIDEIYQQKQKSESASAMVDQQPLQEK